ncbi:MAG: proteasome accessory factor PafA2 family protein, partial [Actinomycetota bacterium]|nr:proteasome accessory factor PafA2 family protein [Actinomycetota bacterium]
MERLERLVNLVAALLDAERPISREDLRVRVGGYAEDTDAFRRNFERDKDLLRQMGMPVVVEPIDPLSLDRECDWVIKHKMIEAYRERHGLTLTSPKVALLDLQYHDVN